MQITVFKCAWCAEHLLDRTTGRQTRSDKRFCNASCRRKYNRWLKQLEKHEWSGRKAIAAIAEYLDHPAAQSTAVLALKALLDAIEIETAAHGLKVVE